MTGKDQGTRTIKSAAGLLALVAVLMFGFGYAMVPLYEKFCEITGIGTRTGGQYEESDAVRESNNPDRRVLVHFDANVNSALPWDFQPTERFMEVAPGKIYETVYLARNRSAGPVVAQAVPSVAPGQASLYFNKIECFCFTEQQLDPGEAREMPVRFVVDPDLPKHIDLVTLSYIIYKNDEATDVLAAAAAKR